MNKQSDTTEQTLKNSSNPNIDTIIIIITF